MLLTCSLTTQITFSKKYRINSGIIRDGQLLPNGNYVIGYNEIQEPRKGVVLLTDESGEIIWTQEMVTDKKSQIQKIGTSPENEIYALIEIGDNLNTQAQLILLKLNTQGQKIWDILLGTNFNSEQNMTVTEDGNILVTHNLPSDNFRCIKINNNGEIIWAKSFTNNGIGIIVQISEDTDGNYWFLCRGKNPNTINDFVTHLLKVSPGGNPIYTKSYNFPNSVNMDIFENNEMTVTGFVPNDDREFVMKLKSDGAIIWAYKIDSPFNIAGAYTTADGHIILSGIYNGPGTISILKMDESGETIWERGYNGGYTNFRQAFETADGIAIFGRSTNTGNIGGLFFKTDLNGLSEACDHFNSCTAKEPMIIDTLSFSWSVFDFLFDPQIDIDLKPSNMTVADFCEPGNEPHPFFEIPDTICVNTCLEINNLSQANAESWAWHFENATPSVSNTQNPGSICYDETGNFQIEHIIQFAGCIDSAITDISVVPVPAFDLGKDTILCTNELFEITISVPNADNYLWSDGVTGTIRNIKFPGNYRLEIDLNYCTISDSIFVDFVTCDDNIFVPTAFSPNGDEVNDFFDIFYADVEIINTQIFNRWGSLVFNSDNEEKLWDGKINGENAEPGTYVYLINYINLFTGEEKIKAGEVLLIR